MTASEPLERTTLSVSKKARARVKAVQRILWRRIGYKPAYSEVVIRGMEALEGALEREQANGQ